MKTILIADDEANLRTLVRTTLEDPGLCIIEAANGTLALELVRSKKPDLVLLDWMMPGLTGTEVLSALQLAPDTASLPVIFLTAKGQEKDRLQALALGAHAYLVKPFSPLDLLEKVHKALEFSEIRSGASANPLPALTDEVRRQLDHADSQLAFYARDLRRVVDSDRRKAEDLFQANERLKTLNTLKSNFLAFISHELRTPLHAMSAVDLVDPAGDPTEQGEIIEAMKTGYERLHGFIKRSLEYFNWLAIEKVQTTSVANLDEVIRAAARRVSGLDAPGVDFAISGPCGSCCVQGEPADLEEVLEILLDNALQFSPDTKQIQVDLRRSKNTVRITVSDRGMGLTRATARELFQPYTIANVTNRTSRTGLNLAIAHAIVRSHGGTIEVESPGLGRGSNFIVAFPAAVPDESLRQPRAHASPEGSVS